MPIEPTDAERATARSLIIEWKADWQNELSLEDSITTALATARAEGWKAGVEAAARVVPTTWLDAMLTGPKPTLVGGGPWGCQDLERLLRALATKIRALAGPGEREGT